MEKRGQTTILIILGIIIVVLAIFVIQSKSIRVDRIEDIIIPEQAKGVVSYTNDCLADLANQGLNLIGTQGGYIVLPNEIRYNPRSYLQAVSGIKVPYWVLGEESLRIPDVEDFESELKNYIDENFLERCNYEEFIEEGYNFELGDINSDVKINKENVYVKLNNKIVSNFKDYTFSLDEYILADVNNKIGRMLDMARKLIQREIEDNPLKANAPLEFNTMNLIGIYSRQDPRIPPVAGMDISCGEKRWSKIVATNAVKEVLKSLIPCLKVDNTNYNLCSGQELYKTMLIDDVFSKNYDDIEINFEYLEEWPFFMDISPSKGDTIKMDRLKIDFPFVNPICINFNWFRYDIRYPILVTMKDDNGNPLRFVIEVLIKDNYYRKRLFSSNDRVEPGRLPNFFCDENQKQGTELSVITFNGKDGSDLEGVEIIYSCDEFRTCLMGKTELENGNAIFTSKLPLCQGGELSLFKEGYLPHKRKLTSFDEITPQIIELEPFRIKRAKVMVLEREGDVIVKERELIDGESVYLQLDRLNENLGSYDWQNVYTFNGNEMQDILLVPGNYDLNINLNWEKDFVLGDSSEKINGAILGGANFIWNVNNIIDEDNEIVFYVVSNGIPKLMVDLENNLNYDEILAKFENRLIPEFT